MTQETNESTTVERHRVQGFAFPVFVRNAPLRSAWGETFLDVDEACLLASVIERLLKSEHRWTGAQARAARNALGMTQRDLARELGVSGHTTVVNWEAKEDRSSRMQRPVEFSFRLLLRDALGRDPIHRRLPQVSNHELRNLVNGAPADVDAPELEFDASELQSPMDPTGLPAGEEHATVLMTGCVQEGARHTALEWRLARDVSRIAHGPPPTLRERGAAPTPVGSGSPRVTQVAG